MSDIHKQSKTWFKCINPLYKYILLDISVRVNESLLKSISYLLWNFHDHELWFVNISSLTSNAAVLRIREDIILADFVIIPIITGIYIYTQLGQILNQHILPKICGRAYKLFKNEFILICFGHDVIIIRSLVECAPLCECYLRASQFAYEKAGSSRNYN